MTKEEREGWRANERPSPAMIEGIIDCVRKCDGVLFEKIVRQSEDETALETVALRLIVIVKSLPAEQPAARIAASRLGQSNDSLPIGIDVCPLYLWQVVKNAAPLL